MVTVLGDCARRAACRCRQGLEKAKKEEYDAVIVDTAGRLQIDEKLMEELREVGAAGRVVLLWGAAGVCLCACVFAGARRGGPGC